MTMPFLSGLRKRDYTLPHREHKFLVDFDSHSGGGIKDYHAGSTVLDNFAMTTVFNHTLRDTAVGEGFYDDITRGMGNSLRLRPDLLWYHDHLFPVVSNIVRRAFLSGYYKDIELTPLGVVVTISIPLHDL